MYRFRSAPDLTWDSVRLVSSTEFDLRQTVAPLVRATGRGVRLWRIEMDKKNVNRKLREKSDQSKADNKKKQKKDTNKTRPDGEGDDRARSPQGLVPRLSGDQHDCLIIRPVAPQHLFFPILFQSRAVDVV